MKDWARGRHQIHLRHGWPIVVNLLVFMVIEHLLGTILHFGVTPFDWFLPHSIADPLWEVVGWTLFGLVVVLYLTGHMTSLFEVTVAIMVAFTLALGMNVVEIARTLPQRAASDAMPLLMDGALVWWNNVLLFTLWYWLLDGGGYLRRVENDWAPRDFLFPPQAQKLPDYPDWRPGYWDYLFLAFSTSTALSPADTLTLSPRAKVLQMVQATLSLAVIALIVARAVNTLSGG